MRGLRDSYSNENYEEPDEAAGCANTCYKILKVMYVITGSQPFVHSAIAVAILQPELIII